jgi:hypothetical protein
MANRVANTVSNIANTSEPLANADKKLRDDAACYMRYRDPAARRAYMREYMRKRRNDFRDARQQG